MQMTHYKKVMFSLVLVGAAQILSSCGEEAGGAGGISSLIKGTSWDGTFQQKKDGNFLTRQYVNMAFARDGQFQLSLASAKLTKAEGTYKDLSKSTRLLMNVRDSNLSNFANSGDSREFSYSIVGEELVLKSDDGEFVLGKNANDSNGEKDKAETMRGTWKCIDKHKNEWVFDIDDGTFWGRVDPQDNPAIGFNGHTEVVDRDVNDEKKDKALILKVDASREHRLNGLEIRASFPDVQRDKNTIEMIGNGAKADMGTVDSFKCTRS